MPVGVPAELWWARLGRIGKVGKLGRGPNRALQWSSSEGWERWEGSEHSHLSEPAAYRCCPWDRSGPLPSFPTFPILPSLAPAKLWWTP